MKVLAIDSSSLVASVAIVSDQELIAEYTTNYKKTHSQTLMPMLDEIIKTTNIDLNDIDGIAISKGPGSFTGLRIGAATVKGLGLVLDKPIIPVPTVDGLAYNLYNTKGIICPLMDARRNQVYTGLYRWKVNAAKATYYDDEFEVVSEQKVVEIVEIAEEINKTGEEVVFLGDGIKVFEEDLRQIIQVPYSFAPSHLSKQRASSVGALGIKYLKRGLRFMLMILPQFTLGSLKQKESLRKTIKDIRSKT